MGSWVSTDGWYALDVEHGLTAWEHDGGALVLFANSAEDARSRAEEWVRNHREPPGPYAQWKTHQEFEVKSIRRLEDDEFYVFPDAGCC